MTRSPIAPIQRSRGFLVVLVAGMFLVALNMRAAIIAIPPLMDIIQVDTGLSATAAGLVMTLPVICFALFSLAAPAAARRFGLDLVIFGAMVLVCAGIALRMAPPVPLLFLGTAVIGIAIALGNVLVPAVVKRDFPGHPGAMMSLYGTGMAMGGTLAAALMVPILEQTALGWRGTLGTLGIPAAIAVAALAPRLRRNDRNPVGVARHERAPHLWGDLMAWQISLMMGLQAFVFYGLGSWAPSILTSHGMSEARAGLMWSLCNLGTIAMSFVAPLLFARGWNQRLLVTIATGLYAVAIVGMLGAPTTLTWLWMVLLGMGSSAAFSAVLMFIVQRTPDADHAAALSGMAQAVGYGIAATAPFMFGALRDLTGGWGAPMVVMLVAMVPLQWASLGACRPVMVGGASPASPPAVDGASQPA